MISLLYCSFLQINRLAILILAAIFVLLVGPPSFPSSAVSASYLDTDFMPNSWSSVPSMNHVRAAFTATLLNDGRVLVVGGQTADGDTATAEIYDPIMNTWTTAAEMSLPREQHTATLLPNGRVLIVGGYDNGVTLDFTEIYDPSTDTWSPAASMHTPRFEHRAVLVNNTKVLVIAGFNGPNSNIPIGSAELYDPVADTWSEVPSMQAITGSPSATLLGSGKVLVVGQCPVNPCNVPAEHAEVYDPDLSSWSLAHNPNHLRASSTTVLMGNGKVLLVGGGVEPGEVYDPTTDSWSDTPYTSHVPNPPEVWNWATTTLLGDGKVLVAGGLPQNNDPSPAYPYADIFDPSSNTWSPAPNMSQARAIHTATLLASGQVLVAGGVRQNCPCPTAQYLSSVELYTPACTSADGNTCETNLTLSITGPSALSVANSQYSPNPFTIMGTVRNDVTAAAQGVQATLYLPSGLTLDSGSITQNIGVLAAGEVRQLSWNVRATGVSADATLNYFLGASATNAQALPQENSIFVPGLLSILQVTPNEGGNAGNVTVDIYGSGFQDGATVQLGSVMGQNTVVVSDKEIKTTFDLTEQEPGTQTVVVTNPDNSTASASQVFTVVEGGEGQLAIDLLAPAFVRLGVHESLTQVPFYLAVRNEGIVDITNVMVELSAVVDPSSGTRVSGQRTPIMTLVNPGVQNLGFGTSVTTNYSTIPAGVTRLQTWLAGGIAEFCVGLLYDDPCMKELLKAHLANRNLTQRYKDLKNLYKEFSNKDCAHHLSELDCQRVLGEVGFHWAFVVDSWGKYYAAMLDLQKCAAQHGIHIPPPPPPPPVPVIIPPLLPPLPKLPPPPSPLHPPGGNLHITCSVGSYDPNDKYGPSGSGTSRYVLGSNPVNYAVAFENESDATAAAQQVVITDQLDVGKLDLSTFSLGPINFGATQITPPQGLKQYSTDIDLRPASNLIARVNASLNQTTGIATWTFTSLDPATGLPTTDVLAGFLPPNQTSPEGEGTVLYSIQPKAGLGTGTEIRNHATIVFDMNDPMDTPEWLNTLDNSKPTSQVQSLAASQSTTSFPVSWSGTDQGAGVVDYTIYVADSSGPYLPWLTDVISTTDTYNGQVGHTYQFYSVARDNVGNVEDTPTAADATTSIIATPTNTPTLAPTATSTPTKTFTPTRTPTRTPANTPTITFTPTPTQTATQTPTKSLTPTSTPTTTQTPTVTPTLACTAKPAAPVLIKPKNNGAVKKLKVKLDWNDVSCANTYTVIIRDGSKKGPKIQTQKNLAMSQFKTKTLTSGDTYFWRITANNDNGSTKSVWRSFTVQ